MTERPILFSGPMVRAILSGQKTVTRRHIKPTKAHADGVALLDHGKGWWPYNAFGDFTSDNEGMEYPIACPYGVTGDRLWVRETFYAFGRWETRYSEKKRRDEWHFVDMTLDTGRQYQFEAPIGQNISIPRETVCPSWWKRPSIHMPRIASRILLEVTDVNAEHLQDISDEQCIAEGIGLTDNAVGVKLSIPSGESMPRYVFKELWESLNGAGSWAANPLVWAVESKQVTP